MNVENSKGFFSTCRRNLAMFLYSQSVQAHSNQYILYIRDFDYIYQYLNIPGCGRKRSSPPFEQLMQEQTKNIRKVRTPKF